MMKAIPKLWWVVFSLFLIHQITEKIFDFHIAFFDSFLDPFLSIPIILGIHLTERRLIFERNINFKLPLFEVLVITIFLSLVFEFIFPKYFEGFYSDPLDFVSYGLGTLFFWFFMNKESTT